MLFKLCEKHNLKIHFKMHSISCHFFKMVNKKVLTSVGMSHLEIKGWFDFLSSKSFVTSKWNSISFSNHISKVDELRTWLCICCNIDTSSNPTYILLGVQKVSASSFFYIYFHILNVCKSFKQFLCKLLFS